MEPKLLKFLRPLKKKFEEDNIPWSNCVALSVDNTSTMIGVRNSVASRFLEKKPEIFVGGCPCHLAHIAASQANDAFSEVLGLNVENVCIDAFYWFDKSSKRKGKLTEYFEFCDQEFQGVLKHLSVRWLSLERCLERITRKFPSLKSYFLSEHWADERFQRLHAWFENPMLELALLFQTSVISMFTNFNLLLQREEPTIHLLKPAMEHLGKQLAGRIVEPRVLKDVTSVSDLNLDDSSIYKSPNTLFIGFTTKCTLNKLLNDGTITERDETKFYKAAFSYFQSALEYVKTKFPLENDVISNSMWIDVSKRLSSSWEHVQFFVEKHHSSSFLQSIDHNALYEEFVDYQTLSDDSIPKAAWEESKVIDGKDNEGNEICHYRVDILWWHLGQMNCPGSSTKRFKLLLKVAEIVLVHPHSNAGLERLFSIVRKNKTESRSCLKLDGTLSSILAMKSKYPESSVPCHRWKPDDSILKAAKSATCN